MQSFNDLGINFWYFLLILGIGGLVFLITYFIFPPLIQWLKKRKYIGYDIHKTDRPATAESGGLGMTFGILIGLILTFIFFPQLWRETLVFIITIGIAALIGWIDDRKQLSSLKKIILMFCTGIPIFLADLPILNLISVSMPQAPILGRLQLNIIYPLALPFIIMIMTNTVNMLEGYNGEGSGTCSIATFFLIIGSILLTSGTGLIYGVIVLGAILAFFIFNKFPAKVFPGDIGTLVIGAALGLIGIMGSLEAILVIVMLPQIFNSFYVIASVRGFKESHSITKKDIWLDEHDYIHATPDRDAPLTLPRIIVAHGKLREKPLVDNFMALSAVSGGFSIIGIMFLPSISIGLIWKLIISLIALIYIIYITVIFRKIRGLTVIMAILLTVGFFFLWIIDKFIDLTTFNWNWLFGGIIGVLGLTVWYIVTLYYFRFIQKNHAP